MKFSILFYLFSFSAAFGGLSVNGKLINKKGIDQGFVIVTETHFLKDFLGKKPIQVTTKNGVKIELVASFLEQDNTYGPSDLVVFQGDLFDKAGNPLGIFGKGPIVLKLGEEKKFESSKWKGQLLEFTLKPEIN
jgi:hypothetical protein